MLFLFTINRNTVPLLFLKRGIKRKQKEIRMAEQPFSVEKVHDGVFMLREVFYESLNQANIWLVQGSSSDLVIDTGIGLWDLPGFLRHVNGIQNQRVILVGNSRRCEFSHVNTPLYTTEIMS